MKFKYMIRGLGLGVIITAAVLGAYNRNAVADARVAVLKDYGLDGESPLAEETSTAEEASAAESTEPVIMRDDEKEAEIESVLDAAKDDRTPQKKPSEKRILTIPNILSFFRLCLIPLFVWLYCVKKDYMWTAIVLLLSGATDMADGYIARRFQMVSALGKVLDPIADKLTQGAMLLCLFTRFPYMLAPVIFLVIKEVFDGVMGLLVIKKTKQVFSADWHGKAATFLLYAMMLIHLVWYDIPSGLSNMLICLCMAVMMLSMALYGIQDVKILRENREER